MKRHLTLMLLVCSLNSIDAHAGNSYGTPINLGIHAGDVVMFAAGTFSAAPACNTMKEWAFSLQTPAGRAMYALLLQAQTQNKKILVYGTNSCSVWGDRETPYYIRID